MSSQFAFQEARFLERDNGGLPMHFHSTDGLNCAIASVLDDSYTRTGGFEESAEVFADLLMGVETKMMNYAKSLNGKLFTISKEIS